MLALLVNYNHSLALTILLSPVVFDAIDMQSYVASCGQWYVGLPATIAAVAATGFVAAGVVSADFVFTESRLKDINRFTPASATEV